MHIGKRNNIFAAYLIALCMAFSSCRSSTDITAGMDGTTVPELTESSGVSQTEVTTVRDLTDTAAEITETTSLSPADTEASDSEKDSESDLTETGETSAGTTEVLPTETARTDTEPAETALKTEQTTTAAKKPPAEVVIPKIKMPEASGEKVVSGENSEVDYSFAGEGYVSAVYSGSAAGAKIRIKCGDIQYDHNLSAGGKREFFPLMGSGSYDVKIYEQFSGNKYKLIAEGSFEAAVKDGTKTYRYPNKYVNYNGSSVCVKRAAEVCAGAADDVERIALIFGYITENITYDKQLAATVQSGYVPDPDSTLSKGKGICFDYASLFAAMCRSQSIPARLVVGYAEPDIYHAWNEVYTEETGWITPELFLRKKGYNIADATFYAGTSDKEKISAYISDEGNYSALYRY